MTGLPAKPIIDILLQVSDSSDEEGYVPPLAQAGFVLRIREPDWYEHRCFIRRLDEGAAHSVNVHVFSPRFAAPEIARMLTFRDWLRTHDDDRDQYAATKRVLATRDWKYVQNYADAKSEVIEAIIARATRST